MIFKIPVGEKRKRLRLSLNLGGTLARPSARFCMAFFSRWLGIAGCAVGLSVGAVRPRDAEGAALVSRTELVDGAERSGCAARATFTEPEGGPPDFESPERALSSSGFMVDPRAWWCLTGPSALSLHGGGRLSPGNQRRAPTAAGRLSLARTQLWLPADKPSPSAALVATGMRHRCLAWELKVPSTPPPPCCQRAGEQALKTISGAPGAFSSASRAQEQENQIP